MTSCHLVIGAAGMLLAIGLVMVFSASAIEAALADQPAWRPGVDQLVFAAVGLVAALVAVRLPTAVIRRWAPDRAAGRARPAAAGRRAGDRHRAQRLARLVRPGVHQLPALRGGQARAGAVGGARAGAAGQLPDRPQPAAAARPGLPGHVRAAHARAGLRRDGHPRPRAVRAAARRRGAVAGVGWASSAPPRSPSSPSSSSRPTGWSAGPRSSTPSPTRPTPASRRSAASTRWPPAASGAWAWATAR